MPKRKAIGLLLFVAIGVAVLLWWIRGGLTPDGEAAQKGLAVENRLKITRPERAQRPRPPALADQEPVPVSALSPEIVRQAVDEAWPDMQVVRCSARDLQDGWIRARPSLDNPGGTVLFATVDDGVFLAVVDGADGEAVLFESLTPAARLTWVAAPAAEVGACTLHPLVTHTLRGRVFDTDGTPAAEADVRGCLHGDIAVTDGDGRFTTSAVEGCTCFPMAFLDRNGMFARSNAPQVDVGDEPPPEVRLELQRGWTPEEQRVLMRQLAGMLEQSATALTASNPAADAAAKASDPAVSGLLWAWGHAQEDAYQMIWDDLERLTEEEDPYVAFRDLWMNQY